MSDHLFVFLRFLFLSICVYLADSITSLPIKISCATNNGSACILDEHFELSDAFDFTVSDVTQWENVKVLTIANNQRMKIFPTGIFSEFPRLTNLTITANVEVLRSVCFIGANELTEIYFTGNDIERLPESLFAQHAPNLKIFKFPANKIKVVAPFTFSGTEQLQYIGLNGNSLTKIPKDMFSGATNLETLNLLGNNIELIEDGALDLPKLTALDLSYNRLQQLSDVIFINSIGIKSLRITNNQLTQIGRSLDPLSNLTALSLSENVIDDIDLAAVLQHPQLIALDLSRSGLLSVNTVYQANVTYAVEFLDISHNGLPQRDILRRLGSCSNLKKIYVAGNNHHRSLSIEALYDARSQYFPKLVEALSTYLIVF